MEIIAGIIAVLSFLFIWTIPLWMPLSESDKFVLRMMQLPPEKRWKIQASIHQLSLRCKALEAKQKYEKYMRELREYEGETHLDNPLGMTDNQTNG